jgi:hypothetical protein
MLSIKHFVYAFLLDPKDVPIILFGFLPLSVVQSCVHTVAEVGSELDIGATSRILCTNALGRDPCVFAGGSIRSYYTFNL